MPVSTGGNSARDPPWTRLVNDHYQNLGYLYHPTVEQRTSVAKFSSCYGRLRADSIQWFGRTHIIPYLQSCSLRHSLLTRIITAGFHVPWTHHGRTLPESETLAKNPSARCTLQPASEQAMVGRFSRLSAFRVTGYRHGHLYPYNTFDRIFDRIIRFDIIIIHMRYWPGHRARVPAAGPPGRAERLHRASSRLCQESEGTEIQAMVKDQTAEANDL